MNKHKHLDLVSAIISRMAQNSFTVRGWSITIVTAIVALGVQSLSPRMVVAALIPIIVFWAIDAFYLWQEQGFRRLYDVVRILSEDEIDFSLTPTNVATPLRVMLTTPILLLLYLGLAIACVTIALALEHGVSVTI